MDMTAQPIEVHLRTDANNLVTTAASTKLPEQKETIHMIQMLRQEACSGQMHDAPGDTDQSWRPCCT